MHRYIFNQNIQIIKNIPIYKDELTGLNYIDFDDYIDNNYSSDDEVVNLIINGALASFIDGIRRNLISLDSVIGMLEYYKDNNYTIEELLYNKSRLNSTT